MTKIIEKVSYLPNVNIKEGRLEKQDIDFTSDNFSPRRLSKFTSRVYQIHI